MAPVGAAVSILPVCDKCLLPKETTRHFSLMRQWRLPEEVKNTPRYAGTIDLCDDCREGVTHDGRAGSHKQRIEFGRVTR